MFKTFCKDKDVVNIILNITLFVFCLHHVNAEVYKWIDEEGKVVYGDKPASNDADEVKVRRINNQNPEVKGQQNDQEKLLRIMQQERDEKNAMIKEEKEKRVEQKKRCDEYKGMLQKMMDARYLYEKTDDPKNPKILSDEARKAEETKYKQYIKKNC